MLSELFARLGHAFGLILAPREERKGWCLRLRNQEDRLIFGEMDASSKERKGRRGELLCLSVAHDSMTKWHESYDRNLKVAPGLLSQYDAENHFFVNGLLASLLACLP